MKPSKVKPSRLLLIIVTIAMLGVCALESFAHFFPELYGTFETIILIVLAMIILLAAADLSISWLPARIDVNRQMPANLSLGKWVEVRLDFRSHLSYDLTIRVKDDIPHSFTVSQTELEVPVQADKISSIRYKVKPTVRGEHHFQYLDIQRKSTLALWSINYAIKTATRTKVYPNFSAIAGYSLLHADNQTIQLGIKKKARRGEGMDFLQLREYREGDSLRQIDWKASSRYQKLISQEYQDARDQQIVVMLDSGRRMRAQDGELSHFDHSLNATLLLSHIALKQGDAVSVFSFGGEERFVPAIKGARNVQYLLNKMYDIYPSADASDYLVAAQSVSQLNRKRSLVVIVSNLRDEDIDDLLVAIRLLQKKHLVLVANLVEDALYRSLEDDIVGFDSAIRYAGIHAYNRHTGEAMERLKNLGVRLITCRPADLSIQVVNSYLQIKNSAIL